MHGDANIWLGSLKRWLPMNHRELPELLEIEFEATNSGKDGHTGIDEEGRALAFEMGDLRLISLGCRCAAGVVRTGKRLRHGETNACSVV